MDNLTHSILAYFLFDGRLGIWQILLFSNLPDIMVTPFWLHRIIKDKIKNFKEFNNWIPSGNYFKIYRSTHSLFFCLMVGLIAFFFTSQYLLVMGCLLTHIFLDVFSHSGKWATRIFYPISDFHSNSFNWFHYDKKIGRYFVVLVIVSLILLLRSFI